MIKREYQVTEITRKGQNKDKIEQVGRNCKHNQEVARNCQILRQTKVQVESDNSNLIKHEYQRNEVARKQQIKDIREQVAKSANKTAKS